MFSKNLKMAFSKENGVEWYVNEEKNEGFLFPPPEIGVYPLYRWVENNQTHTVQLFFVSDKVNVRNPEMRKIDFTNSEGEGVIQVWFIYQNFGFGAQEPNPKNTILIAEICENGDTKTAHTYSTVPVDMTCFDVPNKQEALTSYFKQKIAESSTKIADPEKVLNKPIACSSRIDIEEFVTRPFVCSSCDLPHDRKKMMDNFLRERFLIDSAYRSPDGTFAVLATGQKTDGIVLYAVFDGFVKTFDYLDTTQCYAIPNSQRVPIYVWPNGKGNVLRISHPIIENCTAFIIMQSLGITEAISSYDGFTLTEVPEW
jgi:hypothetical protein